MLERQGPDALGVSRRKFHALLDDGTLVRLRRGVIAGECLIERSLSDRRLAHMVALQVLLLTFDECVASHESAAIVRDLPLLNIPPYVVGTRQSGAWRGGPTSRVRTAPLPNHHVTMTAGLRCTTTARTVVDIARSGPFRDGVVVGDAALRSGCDPALLRQVLDECADWADVGKARRAVRFLDARSESALESVSRAIIHERDLPPPELQVEFDVGPGTTYRVDFFWRAQQVVGEADGLVKYDDPDVLKAEKVRQERLERRGLRIVRWTWREMLVDTDETVARIRAALSR
jgi:very-short-patch-repair endonuclease